MQIRPKEVSQQSLRTSLFIMEGWQQDWVNMMETVAQEVERFFDGVAKEMYEAANTFADFSEEVVEQIERSIAPTFDQFDQQLDEWLEPILLVLVDLESLVDEAVAPVTHTVEPMLNHHPACVGCRHYHGHNYNGNVLVCAMHPYGWEEETCPDWESVTL